VSRLTADDRNCLIELLGGNKWTPEKKGYVFFQCDTILEMVALVKGRMPLKDQRQIFTALKSRIERLLTDLVMLPPTCQLILSNRGIQDSDRNQLESILRSWSLVLTKIPRFLTGYAEYEKRERRKGQTHSPVSAARYLSRYLWSERNRAYQSLERSHLEDFVVKKACQL